VRIRRVSDAGYEGSDLVVGRLQELCCCVFDPEGTGPEPDRDRAIQIGAVRLDAGGRPDGRTFVTLVRPPVPIPEPIGRLTGIRDEDVADAAVRRLPRAGDRTDPDHGADAREEGAAPAAHVTGRDSSGHGYGLVRGRIQRVHACADAAVL